MNTLMDQPTKADIKQTLQHLGQGIDGLHKTYEQAMERIEGQGIRIRELAKRILAWIIHAKRPLSTTELRHALATKPGSVNLDKDYLPSVQVLRSVCAGLVTVDEQSGIARLVHYTTQEYFERTWISWFPDVRKDIAITCVTYLSFDAFEAGFCPTDEEFEARSRLNPLYAYAARNWGYHAYTASADVEQPILDLLKSEAKVSASSQVMMASKGYRGYSQKVPRQMTGVHLAAYFGLREAMAVLLKNRHVPNSKDTYGRTPLSYAAGNGHEAVVQLLLAKDGVDPDFKANDGRTPL
jgi:hypothetical protein